MKQREEVNETQQGGEIFGHESEREGKERRIGKEGLRGKEGKANG